ncbi:helix-turn-helix domain-containing protein [Natrialbaceae archaeon AArc-T1-2]|uniref:helix-turn-helix domain-containing protein n=1 Tax=Natrialbaceae archaeon AArc-T1-2 TaxID=3053904 RepID=UPI00255B258B|nr:helix-turn-helix domain-containing protein [Natrialbaceae archaeon AArc-T1-2]WIV68230.1 helix-turn-helix domain-containing protein [Natrialbaceae archaeon AArc-T1-2]
MSTIAEFRLSTTEMALADTLEYVPDATVRLETAVSRTLSGLWVLDAEREAIESAFEADPTVESATLLVRTDEGLLYDVEFAEDARRLCDELLAEGGSLLEARGADGSWQVRMRFRDREKLCRTHDRLLESGVNIDVRRVTDLDETTATHTRLTPEQQEALSAAFELGYFEIPRRISMEELADELDISHQALSERLRRAYETLVDAELQPTNGSS